MNTPTNTFPDHILSLKDQLAAALAENQRLTAKVAERNNRACSMKVSEKGGLSLYGLGRFPVTLYKSQWIKLLDFLGAPADSIVRVFITEHPELTDKSDK